MHYDRKIKLSQLDPIVDVRYEILEVKKLRHMLVFYELKTAPFQNRTVRAAFARQKVCDAPPTYIWVNVPNDRYDNVPPEQGAMPYAVAERLQSPPARELGMQMDRRKNVKTHAR